MKTFSEKIARIISTIFVPPFFIFAAFIFYSLYFQINNLKVVESIFISFSFTFALPIIFFLVLLRRKKIISIDADIKEERTKPFLIGIIFLIAGLFFSYKLNMNGFIISLWLSCIGNGIIILVINKFWKISFHSFGASTLFGALFFAIYFSSVVIIILVVAVGWSRIKLKCHTFNQVFLGSVLAFFSTYFQLMIFTKLI